jgi:hypothetical protein
MQVLLFLSRPLVIMLWCKMWDLGFGAADAANPYGQMEDAMPAPPPAAPPAGGAGYAGGGDGYKPYGVPDGNPSLGQGGGAYVPPAAAQQWDEPSLSDDDSRAVSATDEIASDRRATRDAKTHESFVSWKTKENPARVS